MKRRASTATIGSTAGYKLAELEDLVKALEEKISKLEPVSSKKS